MKIMMTLLVREEEDILRQNIDFHLSQGVDFIIATDNLSEDSTKSLLKEYEVQGKLHYIFEKRDNYNQKEWVTRMARMAFSEYGADWVINSDSDEFWWPNKGTIKEAILSLPRSINVVEAQRKNFVYLGSSQGERPFYEHMIYKELRSFNSLRKPLPAKVAHKGSEDVVVFQGNDRITGIGAQKVARDLFEIFHFPIRTEKQFLNKIKKGGRAYLNNKQLSKTIGRTWRQLYDIYRRSDNLTEYLQSQYYDEARLKKCILNDTLIQDNRLKIYLDNLYNNE